LEQNKKRPKRVYIGLPRAMMDEVDRIVKKFPMYHNRQKFVESAVQEKIEQVRLYEVGVPSTVELREKQSRQ